MMALIEKYFSHVQCQRSEHYENDGYEYNQGYTEQTLNFHQENKPVFEHMSRVSALENGLITGK